MSGAWEDNATDSDRQPEPDHEDSHINFDFFSAMVKPKKWHPDKKKDHDSATSRFQEINEAYQVLSDPSRRQEYDEKGMLYVNDFNIVDYLKRYKGLILTCNGLGMKHSIW
ncbi:uncharacterized protein LOC111015284 isoform X2 [Momordica charantia]|uniref:Uncharacterized protein LOC111015284 isoform X2 n=1 Tax=Momordica charantia TaxID=3673 RepID=A0A6J1CW76_MOMCH|nr:uncharacterized protein LOC111015284 isoform X2 [Momordica charantia]